jgi:hypothetical protein
MHAHIYLRTTNVHAYMHRDTQWCVPPICTTGTGVVSFRHSDGRTRAGAVEGVPTAGTKGFHAACSITLWWCFNSTTRRLFNSGNAHKIFSRQARSSWRLHALVAIKGLLPRPGSTVTMCLYV